MEEAFKDPVPFTKGINLREAMSSGCEFHIDMDFKKNPAESMLHADDELFQDLGGEADSDSDDPLQIIKESTEKKMLASPEYHSFEDLTKKMVDCEPQGLVKLHIFEEGEGPLVPVDAEVTIHYAAYWEKASIPFDSTLTMNYGNPTTIRLGQGRILPGIELGLTTVKGPRARFMLLVQPAAAWGARGVPPRIKPEPALFVIALYDVRDTHAAVRFNDLPQEQQAKFEVTARTVKALHEEAKTVFNRHKYDKAIKNYQQSINVLKISQPENEDEETEVKNLKIKAFLNLALCYVKINKPKAVLRTLESLDYVTDVEKQCKGLFYYGKANELLGKTEIAVKYYKKALEIEPKNRDIGKALHNLEEYAKKAVVNEKEMWQSAFKAKVEEKFDVDEDFQQDVKVLFDDLAESKEYAKFDLPSGLNKAEVDFVKHLAKKFEKFVVFEDGEGKKKKVTIVKKLI